MIADLGGDVSTQQDAIISVAAKTKLILDFIDVWLLQQPSLIDKRKRRFYRPFESDRDLALSMLWLERQSKVKTLGEILNGQDEQS